MNNILVDLIQSKITNLNIDFVQINEKFCFSFRPPPLSLFSLPWDTFLKRVSRKHNPQKVTAIFSECSGKSNDDVY